MRAGFALQFTSPTTGRQLQYISQKETGPKCQAEAFVRKLWHHCAEMGLLGTALSRNNEFGCCGWKPTRTFSSGSSWAEGMALDWVGRGPISLGTAALSAGGNVEWRMWYAADRKSLMAKITLQCWRQRFFHVCAIAFLDEAKNFTWAVLYIGTP